MTLDLFRTATCLRMTRSLLLAGVVVTGGVAVSLPALAADAPAKPAPAAAPAATPAATATDDPVLARVNGQEIHRSEVLRAVASLPPQVQQQLPPPLLIPAVLDQMINGKLVSAAGYAQKLQDDKDVKDRLKRAEERIVQDVYMSRAVQGKLSDARLQEAYKTFQAENPAKEEVKASHILVATEELAKELITQIKGGADFAALAKEKSTDKAAAAQGGDLGYFSREDMVEAFAQAAFDLKPGTITETPVKTEFGYHIIKVDDRRMAPPPSFDEIKPQLSAEVSQQIASEIVDGLRASAKIERFQMDGSPEKKADDKKAEEKKPEAKKPEPAKK